MQLPHKAIQNFLINHPLGTLATKNKKGEPELTTVYVLVNPDLSCHIVTKASTRKYKNILNDTFGSLIVHHEEELTSVEVTGKCELVLDTIEVVKALERFQTMAEERRVGYWVPPVAQLNAGIYVIIKLKPTKILYRRYTASKRSGKNMTEFVLRKKQKQLELSPGNH